MEFQEFADVINPQIAVPVVGVVLCAVLVFAFGFKSPVQPPSFDFEDEKKTKKSKKHAHDKMKDKKINTQTNGQLPGSVEITQTSNIGKHPVTVKPTQTSKPVAFEQTKTKLKKSNKIAEKPETPALPKVVDEADNGEWTTAISRKDKKLRKEKDSQKDGGNVGDNPEIVESSVEVRNQENLEKSKLDLVVKEAGDTSPMEQRKRKDKSSASRKKLEAGDADKSTAPTSPKKKNDSLTSEKSTVSSPEISDKKNTSVSSEVPIEKSTTSPVAAKKNILVSSDTSVKKKLSKASNRQQQEVAEIEKVKVTIAPDLSANKNTSPSKSEATAKKNTPSKSIEKSSPSSSSRLGAEKSAESSSKPSSSTDSKSESHSPEESSPQPVISFDELSSSSDWHEAKPVKKKKKARREN